MHLPDNPSSEDFLLHAFHHLTRDKTGTPFISFSQSLVWVLFRALRTSTYHPHISIIHGPEAAAKTNVYAAFPVKQQLREKCWWPKTREFRYGGVFEILVWEKVEKKAIIHDFSLLELQDFALRRRDVRRFLRLRLFKGCSRMSSLRQRLLDDSLALNASVGKALGELLIFFGLTPASEEEIIFTLLYSLLQGWAIHPPITSDSRQAALEALQTAFKVGQSNQLKVNRAFNDALYSANEDICEERNGGWRGWQSRLLKS
jgi:hypothetical protein